MKHFVNIVSRKIKLLNNAGRKYYCVICNYNAKQFLDSGLYSRRKNVKCPKCRSLVRHRHLWLYLTKNYGILEKKKSVELLHFAPEKSLMNGLSKVQSIKYYTSEYSQQKNADFHFDIQKIDYENNQFDIIICSHVLEHVPDDYKAMQELYRILRVGGEALIQVPLWPSESHPTYENSQITDPRDRIIHYGQYDHLRIYGLDIVEKLTQVGFKVSKINIETDFSDKEKDYFRLSNPTGITEWIFRCKK